VRRSEKQITDKRQIEEILHAGKVCQLAFNAEPAPYIVTLNYGYHGGALYFHSAATGRKMELMAADPMVAFTVAIDLGLLTGKLACNWSNRFQSVVGHGRIHFLKTDVEKRQGLDRIMAQYSDQPFSFLPDSVAATEVYKLEILSMTAKQSRVES